jgi:hypothetical protein
MNLFPRVSQGLRVKAGFTQVQGEFFGKIGFFGEGQEKQRNDPTRMRNSQGVALLEGLPIYFRTSMVRINGKLSVAGQSPCP